MPRRIPVAFLILAICLVLLGACAKKAPTTPGSYDPSRSHSGDVGSDVGFAGYDADSQEGGYGTSELDSAALLGTVYFEYDRYDIVTTARHQLEKNAEYLLAHPMVLVTIEGHCDERGTNEYNLALGARRAEAAKRYLVQLGIDASRLGTLSYGEERPVCTLSNEDCWRNNRRAHFMISSRSKLG